MKTLQILVALFALTFVALTTTSAQTSRAAEWKQRVANRIASGERPQAKAQTERAEESTEKSETKKDNNEQAEALQDRMREFRAQQKNALAGCWDLTLMFSDGSSVKSTLTVSAGRRDGEGAVIHAAEASLLLPNPTTPEQGAWEHIGGLRFIASYAGYAVDEKFEKPAGKIGFRHSIRLSADQESFTGRAIFEVRDPEGNVVFSDEIQTKGVRHHAEAP